MARKPRIQFPGAFYHVIARGNGGQKIFRDSQDYEQYLSYLRECRVRFGFLLYAYAFMPTHLLLEMNETPGADRFGKYCVKHIEGFIVQQHP
jgi:REP element-mobilizing transposase RayT